MSLVYRQASSAAWTPSIKDKSNVFDCHSQRKTGWSSWLICGGAQGWTSDLWCHILLQATQIQLPYVLQALQAFILA